MQIGMIPELLIRPVICTIAVSVRTVQINLTVLCSLIGRTQICVTLIAQSIETALSIARGKIDTPVAAGAGLRRVSLVARVLCGRTYVRSSASCVCSRREERCRIPPVIRFDADDVDLVLDSRWRKL